MNTTVKALQELYVKKGGNLEDVSGIVTIPDMIDAIAGISDTGKLIATDDGEGNVTLLVE